MRRHEPGADPDRPAPGPHGSGGGRLIAFGAIMTVAMTAATLQPFALGALAPFVTEELALSRSQFGALSTALFVVAAALSPAAGRLSDRLDGRLLSALHFVLAAAAFAGMAAAGGYVGLLLACLLGGIPQALGNPLTNTLVSRHVRRGRQGLLIGVKQSGVQLGVALAGATLPASAVLLGWRATVLATGGIILLFAFLAWPVVEGGSPGATADPEGGRTSIWPTVRWLAAYAVLMGSVAAVVATYLPLYAYEALAMSPAEAGRVGALTGVFGVASRIVWGWWSERSQHIAVLLGMLASGAVAAQLLILLAPTAGAGLVWAGAALFGATAVAWNAVGMFAILRLLDPADAGRASGWVLTGFFLGFIVSPPLFGYVVDVRGEYVAAWAGTVAASAAAVALCAAWVLQGRLPGRASPIGVQR